MAGALVGGAGRGLGAAAFADHPVLFPPGGELAGAVLRVTLVPLTRMLGTVATLTELAVGLPT